jgi:hypothetical protein
MSTICQVYYLIVGGMFYKKVGRLWRVSDCEELVGVTLRRLNLLNSTEYQG